MPLALYGFIPEAKGIPLAQRLTIVKLPFELVSTLMLITMVFQPMFLPSSNRILPLQLNSHCLYLSAAIAPVTSHRTQEYFQTRV